MATSDILQFAGGGAANVLSQADYAPLASILANGYQSGILDSNLLNKTLRQSNFMAVGLANFLVNEGISVPDDGNVAALATNIRAAIQALINAGISLSAALNFAKGTPVAAAATTNIWVVDGNLVHVTGTGGPITSFGNAPQAGATRMLIVDSAGVIITNGANLATPEGVDIVTSAGDQLVIVADTTTAHRVASYVRAGTTTVTGSFTRDLTTASGSQTISGLPFKPKRIRFTLSTGTTTGMSIGNALIDGSAQCTYLDQTGAWLTVAAPAIAVKAASNYQQMNIGAWNSDGFRADWTKVNAPTGTATIQYRAEM